VSTRAVPYGGQTYRLLGADGGSYYSFNKGLFDGNRRGKVYGQLDCPSALRAIERGHTYEQYRVFFADERTAIAAGFRPCGICMRQAYKKWQASPRQAK
jgi:methylphosphotriester-DNA--protein-cysteine methyltransferase